MADATRSTEKTARYRKRLTEMRDRLLGEVDQMIESIRQETNPSGNLSNAPVHLADAAEQVDADIEMVENQRDLMSEVQDALHRLDDGTFGKCADCGTAIVADRLELIPYARYCVRCATKHESDDAAADDGLGRNDFRRRVAGS